MTHIANFFVQTVKILNHAGGTFMKFSSTLKALREEKHITQEELASYLGITRSAVAGYETKGKQPDFERLILIAKFFNVSIDYLISGKEYSSVSVTNKTAPNESNLLRSYRKLSKDSKIALEKYLLFLLATENET